MKKRIIVITVILCMVVGFLYLQYDRDVKVISTMNTASGNCYEMDLTVAANRLFIMDQEKFAEELIDRCIANDFHKVEFSYDVMGYPNRLRVKVYLNETSNRHFTIYYDVNEGNRFDYNIKDNPEIFESMLIRNDLIMLKCYYLDGVENGFFY